MTDVNKKYKDTVFRLLFSDKEKLLELYNAVNGSHYTNADKLEVNTLQDAVYMNVKNDISFVLHSEMNLYEHQSTVNPNMPLRDLFYVADLLSKIKDLLLKHKAEVIKMFIYEYNEELHLKNVREEGRKEGREEERVNTERERQRADEAEIRAKTAEDELLKYKMKYGSLT